MKYKSNNQIHFFVDKLLSSKIRYFHKPDCYSKPGKRFDKSINPFTIIRFILFAILASNNASLFSISLPYNNSGSITSEYFASVPLKAATQDGQPPVARCKNITVNLNSDGNITITPANVDGGSVDFDGTIVSMTVVPDRFDCSDIGDNTVTLTVTDNEGLSSLCNATVFVRDNLPPVMRCRNTTLYLDIKGTATLNVSEIDNGSSDNCPAGMYLNASRTTFNCSDIGSPVPVILTGTDASGNNSTCTAFVTVIDTISPRIITRTFTLALDDSGSGTLTASDIDNGTFDNCGPVSLSVSPSSFNCGNQGENNVTITASDAYGNSSSRNVTVTVTSTLKITGITLNDCNTALSYALYYSTVEGGSGSYTYFWKGLDPASLPFIEVLPFWPYLIFRNTSTSPTPYYNNTMPAGTYGIQLTVTDGNGCADSSVIVINSSGPLFNNINLKYSDACPGDTKVYSVPWEPGAVYEWEVINGTRLTSVEDTSRIEVLWDLGSPAGEVRATVTKTNLLGIICSYFINETVTLKPADNPAFDDPVTDVCAGTETTYNLTQTYSLTQWTVTGGNITSGGNPSDNFVTVLWGNGPAGTITVNAGNESTCSGSATLDISISNLSGSLTSLTDITCNGSADGSVTAEAVTGSGMPPYMYSLDGGVWQNSGTFTGISPGNHVIIIRDAFLCTFTLPFVINQPLVLSVTISSQEDVNCHGGSDGSVTVTASGGVPPYVFSLDGGAFQSSGLFSGLPAGSYFITVRDANGCLRNVEAYIAEPAEPLAGTIAATDVLCSGESTGSIDITITGGSAPYSYLWSNGASTKDILNIPAGDYSVTVTDANGCVIVLSATVSEPDSKVTGTILSQTNVLCFGESTGSVTIAGSGGTSPYEYKIGTGDYQSSGNFINLGAGNYIVTIRDANLCTADIPVTITQPAAPLSGNTVSLTNVACYGDATGSITVAGSGGTSPYEYSADGGAFQVSGLFTGLDAADHIIIVRDANMCLFSFTVTVTQPSGPLESAILSLEDVKCHGGNDGRVTVNASGGTPPYQYSINSGSSWQSSGVFSNLTAGSYIVTIRDSSLCTDVLTVEIDEPSSSLDVSVSKTDVVCYGASDGTATASATGGTPPYNYSWNTVPVQTGASAINLPAGTYIVTVTDLNGCIDTASVTITQPEAISVSAVVTDVLCHGENSGSIVITVVNGTAPFTYLWNNGATTKDLEDITAGTYTVVVTDVNNCNGTTTATVDEPPPLSVQMNIMNVLCFGESTGAIQLSVSGGTAPYTYLWSNGETTRDINNIPAGLFTVTITDANLCETVVSGDVLQPDNELTVALISVNHVTEYGGNDGNFTVAASGGTPPYQYMIGSGTPGPTGYFGSLTAGTYIVTAIDANLCTAQISVTISQPSIPLTGFSTSQTDVLCYGGNNGSLTVTGWGGTSPYEYSIDGSTYQTSGTFSNLIAGLYNIRVRDAVMDIVIVPVYISEPEPLQVAASYSDLSCRGDSSGTATVTVSGGVWPYSYSWNTSPVQTNATATGLKAGNYTVTVTDANGCVAAYNIIIGEPESEVSLTVTSVNIPCAEGTGGSASVTATGGTPPYTYSWNTSPVQTTQTISGLTAGTYTVTVTDANGCIKTAMVEIFSPSPIVITATVADASCPDSPDGSVSLTVSGGTPPYNVIWEDGSNGLSRSELLPGSYSVIVTDANACASSLTVEINFTGSAECLVIPQIITPNNDGYNDLWIIKNIQLYPNAEVFIYNRWGKLIFRTKNIADNPWDGRSDGVLVPTDSYHYILYLNDGSKPRTGVITVIR